MSERAYDVSDEDLLLEQFLTMLPPFPTSIGVFSAEGGIAEIVLADLDKGLLVGYAPQTLMQQNLTVICPLRDGGGGGYDVTLRVERAYFQASDQTLIHLAVAAIIYQPGHRRAPRSQRSEQADATALYSTVLDQGHRFVVRMADVSADGVAFVTELLPAVGDRIMLSVLIGARPITLEAQVVRTEPVSFGRYRIGCEISAIADHDREAVTAIAAADDEGDESERRPDLAAARARGRSEQHALKSRLTVRRYNR
jgi:hypothetical protein